MFMPTLREYRDEAAVSLSELSRRANVDYKTAKRAEDGEAIQRSKAVALAKALSQILGRAIHPDDIDGLTIS